jgi:hypothetical protein
MLNSIRVRPQKQGAKMDPMSRINFAKIYTIEHNVKVMDFGDVHEDSIHVLEEQWKWALTQDTTGQIGTPGAAELEQIDEAYDEPAIQSGYYAVDAQEEDEKDE